MGFEKRRGNIFCPFFFTSPDLSINHRPRQPRLVEANAMKVPEKSSLLCGIILLFIIFSWPTLVSSFSPLDLPTSPLFHSFARDIRENKRSDD